MTFHASHFTALQRTPFQQHPAYGATLTHLGRPPLRIFLGQAVGEVQLVRRRFGPMGQVGLISRADVTRRDLRRLREATGCRLFVINAETPGPAPGLQLKTGAHVAELSLEGPAKDWRARMAQKWRNRLNRASDFGLKLTALALPPDPGHWLLRVDQAQQVVKRYRGYPPRFTAAFAAANRGQARLFEARARGAPVAALLFLCHGAVATYHIGWSGPEGRAASAHHLLLWRAMVDLAARGVTRLDLGIVDTVTAPGLARFKLGSGAQCRALGGTWLARA
ncbi:GNAT family N-acetyltransferase [Marinovum sp.]|uniref:GNAT family N-acetyltransferase n=1 Tax=Marinovum sp. TaxID=2024839 RepID=UPI002B26B80F|nr:GNAT family N-acetyltransferase [Marinovum sp.]